MKRSFNPAQVPQTIALESVQVASPCHADWDAMHGDDRSRFCPSCAKNVYNLSAMTRPEAELLLQEKEGRLCVRFFVREDGTMLTQDCPVGAAALKERSPAFALWAGVASIFVFVGAMLSPSLMTGAQAQPEINSGASPAQAATPTPEAPCPLQETEPLAMMGDVAPLPRPTQQSANLQIIGEPQIQVAPASAPTPKATIGSRPLLATMGKPSVPVATPKPQTVPAIMGRIAVPQPTPTPKPPPSTQQVPAPLMGAVVMPSTKPSQPAKKPVTTPKKRGASATKKR